MFWGDRYGQLLDPFSFERLIAVTAGEVAGALRPGILAMPATTSRSLNRAATLPGRESTERK